MEVSDLVGVLRLEGSDGAWRARSLPGPGPVVFGGQLLAQSVVAGATIDPAKEVQSISTVFARGARPDQPLEIDVDTLSTGRSFSSASVTIRQGDRCCARSLVLLSAPDPDRIRHAPRIPSIPVPDGPGRSAHGLEGWELLVDAGVDLADPDATGPAELQVWSRFGGAAGGHPYDQALLAYASEGFLIGTAMRPHPGIGQAQAHVSVDTTVLAHQVVFHEPFRAGEWLLMTFDSPYAGRGRSYGRGQVFDADGILVASICQQNMIRDFPQGRTS
ncbi:MAG: acyl-CoA thioesterase [Actinomycetes bacterium]